MSCLEVTYSYPRSRLTPSSFRKHVDHLTLYPEVMDMTSGKPGNQERKRKKNQIIMYNFTDEYLFVPRHYGYKNFGQPDVEYLQEGVPIDVTFNGKLWDDPVNSRFYQTPVADAVMNHFTTKRYGGILCLPTGAGKTQLAMWLIAEMKRKTLIVVDNSKLLMQWEDRIRNALPNARIGRIQGKIIKVDDTDVVLGMLQSIALKSFSPGVFDGFGLVICDETHVLAAKEFSKAIWKFSKARYLLGLSATPERADKMESILYMTLGPMIYRADAATNVSRKISVQPYFFKAGEQKIVTNRVTKRPNFVLMVNHLLDDPVRNDALKFLIGQLLSENRSVLAFSDRVPHLEMISEWVSHHFPEKSTVHYSANLPVGEQKRVDTERQDFVAATYKLFSKGMDLWYCDTILFMSPISRAMQVVGRIRNADGSNDPLIVDFVDDFSCFTGSHYKRRKVYNQKKMKIRKPLRIVPNEQSFQIEKHLVMDRIQDTPPISLDAFFT